MKKGNTYAFNFSPLGIGGTLVKCAASNDTIGVLRVMRDGTLSFWRNGDLVANTRSWATLFRAIEKARKAI